MIELKDVRVDDYWRTALRRDYSYYIHSIGYESIPLFNSSEVIFKPGLNAFVGKNGTGKSTLMRAIFSRFISNSSNQNAISNILDQSYINFKYVDGDVNQDLSLLPEPYPELNVIGLMYDPCTLIPHLQHFLSKEDNFEELLDGFTPVKLDRKQLNVVNYLTNSNYSKVEIYYIEDVYDEYPILPFFVVEMAGVTYNSTKMGLGELSLIYFFWLIDYIKKSERNIILFIEEPESFLPPLTQKRLTSLFGWLLCTQGINIFISTHSEHILNRIPDDRIKLINRVGNSVEIIDIVSKSESLSLLGIEDKKEGIIYTEDFAAKLFVMAILSESKEYNVDNFYYYISGSESDLLKLANVLPGKSISFKNLVVFDGDSRGKYTKLLKEKDYILYLPSDLSPEECIREYIDTVNITDLARYFNVEDRVISVGIGKADGSNHHDYFHIIAKHMKISYEQLFTLFCKYWAINNPLVANEFIKSI